MKAKICHDPASKTLTIPAAALELSGMAEKEELALFTERGSVLLLPNDPSALELLQTVCLLDDVRSRLMELLATAARNEAEESMGRHCEKCAWVNTCHAGILAPCVLARAGIDPEEELDWAIHDGKVTLAPTCEGDVYQILKKLGDARRKALEDEGVIFAGLYLLLRKELEDEDSDEE